MEIVDHGAQGLRMQRGWCARGGELMSWELVILDCRGVGLWGRTVPRNCLRCHPWRPMLAPERAQVSTLTAWRPQDIIGERVVGVEAQ